MVKRRLNVGGDGYFAVGGAVNFSGVVVDNHGFGAE